MVFGAPEANPCVAVTMSTALKHASLPPRDPFAPGGQLSLGKTAPCDLVVAALLQGMTGPRAWMASQLGKKGGAARTEAKSAASLRGGRPRREAAPDRGRE